MEDDKKILVVTSSDRQHKDCADQLNQMGFENIFNVSNGIKALEFVKNNPIDLILSDWDIPKMDGLELLKAIKKDTSLQSTPFIFLTVHKDENKNREAMNHGAVDNVSQSLSSENLRENIEVVLKRGIRNILIVEDSGIQREILIAQLQQIGFENISGASDGKEALSYIESHPVDIILSDLKMPVMDGLELLRKVKENSRLKDIPFLVLTIDSDPNKNQEALRLGALDYIVKPSTPDDLHLKIRNILY
ncbi:MAG: response regulator [Crocinitomicaceae bacterium]|jgi:two-component system, sensor histidine kinase and response regulator|nr:response regulator [Crocinitomicaceae bacterium]